MKKNKTNLYICGIILLIVVFLFTGCSESSRGKGNIIKIGVAQAYTGPIAPYGESIRKGLLLAVKQINGKEYIGKGKIMQIIMDDTEGDPEKAKAVFKRFITQDNVSAIIGPTSSNSAFEAAGIAQDAGIPVIGTSTVLPGITDIGDYVFRTCLPDSVIISNTIKTLVEKRNLSKAAIMYRQDDQFSKQGYDYFSRALKDHNVTICTEEIYRGMETDFRPWLENIKSMDPDALIISDRAEEAARIMVQAREIGITDTYFIGGNGFNNTQLTRIAGKDAEGALFGASWLLLLPAPENKQFVVDFGTEFAIDPDQFSAQAYTALWVLAEAIRKAESSDPKLIRDHLAEIKNFPTPLGKFSFNPSGDPIYEPVVVVVQNTVFSLFDK
jgi:branched-chain amino acid transport system substrate-binding protein